MKKPKLILPTKSGIAFGGGFYAGRFFIGGIGYALIVSPKANGELQSMPWSNSMAMVAGASSYCDGLVNTHAMAKAGSPLAKQLLKLNIGGFEDWYLPSRLELLLIYHELAGAKNFATDKKEAFEKTWYWSSTQHAEHADSAWDQSFISGYQDYWHKDYGTRARAVRRLVIQ